MAHEDYEFVRNVIFFEGHLVLVPLCYFVSIWWTLNVLTNHHRERLSNGRHKFRSRLWYCGPFTQGLPLESVVKAILVGLQLLAQFVGCLLLRFPCNFDTHAQHAVLYVAFLAAALVELATHFQHFRLPEGVDRLVNCVAYLVMAVVFVFHSGHSSPLNDLVHARLIPHLCAAVIVALLLEGLHPTNLVVALLRPYAVAVIGTWFLQVGYMMFPVFGWQTSGSLDGHATRNTNNVPLLFCFHLMAAALLTVLLNCVVVWRLKRHRQLKAASRLANGAAYSLIGQGKCAKCEKCQPLLMADERSKSHLSE